MSKLLIILLFLFSNQIFAQQNKNNPIILDFIKAANFDSERFLVSGKFERLSLENEKKPGAVTTFSFSGNGVWAYWNPATKTSIGILNTEKVSAKGNLPDELALLFVYSPHYMGLLEKMGFAPKWNKSIKVVGLGTCNSVSFMSDERRLVTYYFSAENNNLLASEYGNRKEEKKSNLVKYSDWRMVEGTKVFMYHQFFISSIEGEVKDIAHLKTLEQGLDSIVPAKPVVQPTMQMAVPSPRN